MSKPPLHDLWDSAWINNDPELAIFINSKSLDDSHITAHRRITDDGESYLEYGLNLTPGTREETLNSLRAAIALLERLPHLGTLATLCEEIGTTPEEITT